MATITVEVPEFIAEKFSGYKIIKSEVLFEELENNNVFVNFGKDGIGKKEFEEYLSIKNSL